MPITWTPENEAKMLAAIFQVCEIKLSEAQKREVAGMMGDGCTPKAISHRLQKLKAAGNSALQASFSDDEPVAKRAKTSAPVRGKKKKAAAEYEEEDEQEAFLTPPASGKKRGVDGEVKMEEMEDDEDGGEGIAVGEDIGEGLRATL